MYGPIRTREITDIKLSNELHDAWHCLQYLFVSTSLMFRGSHAQMLLKIGAESCNFIKKETFLRNL